MSKMEREQTTIRLEPELMNKLRHEADKREMSFNALVIKIFRQWLSHQK